VRASGVRERQRGGDGGSNDSFAHRAEYRRGSIEQCLPGRVVVLGGFGSLLDLTAAKIWKLDRGLVEQVYAHRSRPGFPADLQKRCLAECTRLPFGRAAYARCPGALLWATRHAPLPDPKT